MFNTSHITKTIIFALGAFFCGMLAAQGNSRLVAVLEPTGDATSVTALNKRSVRGTLEEFITKSRDYKAVDRARTNAILEEHSFQRNGMVDNDKVQEIGKMLGANFVFVSELLKEEGFINISISLIDVVTGVLAGARNKMMEGDNPIAIGKLVEEMASDLLGVESDQQRQARVQEEKDEKVRREKLDNERLRMQLAKIEADNKEAEARTTAASRAQSPQLFQSSQSVTDFAPVANRAVVYIWRKEMLPNPGGVSLSFNGTYAAKLKSGQYIRAELYEGVYNILGDVREMSVGAGVRRNDSISINVKAGQVYYIHLIGHINVNTWPEFRIQSDAEGRKAVKKSKLISQLFTN